MDQVTLHNYRCFRDEQTARIGRLTLLVGENSTGKTSFLAMLRALWNVAYRETVPNFREAPYDLGRFREIAHYRGGRGSAAPSFDAGFTARLVHGRRKVHAVTFSVTFGQRDAAPFPVARRLSASDAETWVEHRSESRRPGTFRVGTRSGEWEFTIDDSISPVTGGGLPPLYLAVATMQAKSHHDRFSALGDTCNPPSEQDRQAIRELTWTFRPDVRDAAPHAGAPVRSQPLRTYDLPNSNPDPEGEYIPLYLANLRSGHVTEWEPLKDALQKFGHDSGLFDEIDVKLLGDGDGGPFQLQVRKFGRKLKGPNRNLIDIGYGVSQILPVVTELLKRDPQPLFLLQQPEVHLHPSAQAALGSLLCTIAAGGLTQLVIETHSDHLLDRVRMDVRDGRKGLSPEDVSILYFELDDLSARVHSLRIDESGNVLHAPDSYRGFFLDETRRSLGL